MGSIEAKSGSTYVKHTIDIHETYENSKKLFIFNDRFFTEVSVKHKSSHLTYTLLYSYPRKEFFSKNVRYKVIPIHNV